MSNHLHVVLHINQHKASSLSDLEACQGWHRLYKGTLLTQQFEQGKALTLAELEAVKAKVEIWRTQLHDISWFMRALYEPIAHMVNTNTS